MKILVVDLASGSVSTRPLGDPLAGGRLLTAQLAAELGEPRGDPLGPENTLILACGPLAGRSISTGGRLSIGGKSPLTRGIKEANAGGMAGSSWTRPGRVGPTPGPTWAWATRRWRARCARILGPSTSSSESARRASGY
jgi:aldehyde:ferredoxin oxidoreductase